MRMPFNQLFFEVDGHLLPRRHIGIANISFAPGVAIPKSLHISGIEIGRLTGQDLEVDLEDGITLIEGFYEDDQPPPPA